MKIALVVHGRFHAFDLARELIGLGHEVLLLTNYPKRWPEKFGVPARNVRSLVAHGVLARAALAIGKTVGNEKLWEPFLHQWFGQWAAKVIEENPVDASHCFSGVALEILGNLKSSQKIRSIVRGSCHIQVQREILDQEEIRAGRRIDKPSDWMIQRERQEYRAADLIICLSQFAYDSFVKMGKNNAKLVLIPLGVQQAKYQASKVVQTDRENRIMNKKLRVITTGNFSLQKGAIDLVEVATRMRGRMDFIVRGSISQDAKKIYQQSKSIIQFLPRIEQAKLPQDYFNADLFLFPTIQDGYAAVLAQASAAGLPILATTNCGARDFLTEGKDAWIFPIRRPDLMVQRLEWCDKNRKSLAGIAREAGIPKKGIEWRDRAKQLVEAYEEFLARQKG